MMQNQINSHFLFNALNTIASMIADDPKQAEHLIVRLAAYCRTALSQEPSLNWTLDDELELLEMYLDIEEARFQERLRVTLDVSDDSRSAHLPSMILQPILENSIKVGLGSPSRRTSIQLLADKIGDRIEIVLADRDCAFPNASEQTETTLSVARERLQEVFPDASVSISPQDIGGYMIEIHLPFSE